MIHSRFLPCVVFVCVVLACIGCGKKETPEQRLERLRYNHEIIPVGSVTLDRDTNPVTLVDMQVINQGADPLSQLTVLVTIQSADGQEKLSKRVTLDLEGATPGIGERRTARIEGYALDDEDQVSVTLEPDLAADDLRRLPEFADVAQN